MHSPQEMAALIAKLAKEKNVSVNKMLMECGAGKSLLDNMKRGQEPSASKLMLVATYLDVPTDYLLGKLDIPKSSNGFSSKHDELNELLSAKDGAYLRLARGAKDLDLDDEDVDFVLEFLKRGRKQ